jgi:hypothetical protein
MVTAVGSPALPLAGAWLGSACLIALMGSVLPPRGRLLGSALLFPLCVLLVWEGGGFFGLAALTLFASELAGTRARCARRRVRRTFA